MCIVGTVRIYKLFTMHGINNMLITTMCLIRKSKMFISVIFNIYLFIISFFLPLTPTYSLIVDVQGYCCIWSHSMTHTHTRYDSPGRAIGPSHRPLPDDTQHWRGRHPCPRGIRTRNPSKGATADPSLRPRGHWVWPFNIYELVIM